MTTNVRTSDKTTRHRSAWVFGEVRQGGSRVALNLGDLRRLVEATTGYPDDAEVTVGLEDAMPCHRINVHANEEATDAA